MKKGCVAILNLNKKGETQISKLNYKRPIASIPIGARYRIIDFALSNMVNSGIKEIGIYAKEKYRSLTDHLGSGKDWDLSRKKGGLFIFSPENTLRKTSYAYREGDVYNILANIDYIEKCEEEYVLVAPSYMLCNIDYSKVLDYHKKSQNDITVVYKSIENADKDFNGNMTLNLDDENIVTNIGSNMGLFNNANIFMETYIMKRTDFIETLYKIVSLGKYSYLEDFLIGECENLKIGAYEHKGYLKCINSIEAYFEANKDLLDPKIAMELLYSDRRIFTKEKNEAPTVYTEDANVVNSFVATGCIIEGTVKNSIVFRNVHVKKDAVLENCIIMQNCTIESGVELENVIFDKNISISEGKKLNGDDSYPVVVEKNMSI
jgi:glucose-1-phosphate adenylyltransferase